MPKTQNFAYPILPPERPTVGRDAEIETLLDTLYKTRMRNLVLTGPAGCGKTQLVREIAARSPEFEFVEFSVAGSVAGMRYVGDFERRVTEFLAGLPKNAVLFVDEIHVVVGAGSTRGERRELDLANLLKPYLSGNRVALWGATTDAEYDSAIFPDAALRRRLPRFRLSPLPPCHAMEVLRDMAKPYRIDPSPLFGLPLEEAIEALDCAIGHLRRTGELPENYFFSGS